MADGADALSEANLEALLMHQTGHCGNFGPCQYCDDGKSAADVRCGECGAPMVLRQTKTVRNDDGTPRQFYGCSRYPGCRGTHSAHQQTGEPMGVPADAETKAARIAAHKAFDKLWRGGPLTRAQAYYWLAWQMKLTHDEAHIGRFTAEQCREVIRLVKGRTWKGWVKDKRDHRR